MQTKDIAIQDGGNLQMGERAPALPVEPAAARLLPYRNVGPGSPDRPTFEREALKSGSVGEIYQFLHVD